MKKLLPAFAALALASTLAGAQAPMDHPPRGDRRAPVNSAELIHIDAARAQKVDAILENSRSQMRATREKLGRPQDDASREAMHSAMETIRADTDKQLAAVLTPDELAKLRAALPRPPGPPREQRTPM